jgi:hypothetical protein
MLSEKRLFEIFGFYERERFTHITTGHYYVCAHMKPHGIHVERTFPERPVLNKTDVRLQHYRFPDCEGYAGRCDVCGKVYYK